MCMTAAHVAWRDVDCGIPASYAGHNVLARECMTDNSAAAVNSVQSTNKCPKPGMLLCHMESLTFCFLQL